MYTAAIKQGLAMPPARQPATRGRPPSITRERIIEAGLEMGLPNITFVGVASALGVTHMALYKHVPSLEALKHLIAEEIFQRWQIPRATAPDQQSLQDYLLAFSASAQTLVKTHPGLMPYVIRRLAATQPMLDKIDEHQRHIAQEYGLSQEQARWLLATVAFHCLAVADTVYSVAGKEDTQEAERGAEIDEMEAEIAQGMRALIVGALALVEQGVAP